ncbi:hypothetical protein Tcan_11439 [Toxocara canis]|uniref:Secreted protein n=1 Tax=Toxocara canis TaxID=6265 RepID=A0A0B2VSL2_TOXCA|nr:hypothetical protein Tcan_11439 [Toxocara canis]
MASLSCALIVAVLLQTTRSVSLTNRLNLLHHKLNSILNSRMREVIKARLEVAAFPTRQQGEQSSAEGERDVNATADGQRQERSLVFPAFAHRLRPSASIIHHPLKQSLYLQYVI